MALASPRKRLPNTLDQFEDVTHEEWENLKDEITIRICESFPHRIEQWKESQGKRLNY